MIDLGRVLTAMVSPFDKEGKLDLKMAEKLAKHLIANGSDGLVIHGTTGESPTLTHEEEYSLYKTVMEAVKGKAKVVAGTGSNSTETSIKSTQRAEELGVDAVMLVVPYYNKPSQAGLIAHFKAVADSTKLPIILYNIPGRTGINMLPETIAELSNVKNIVAVKEAAGSLDQVSQIRMLTPDDFIIYSGDDSLTLPMLSVGGYGIISVASHVAGNQINKMVYDFVKGNIKEAKEIHLKLLPIFKSMFITTNPAPVKYGLSLQGLDVGIPRLPIVDCTDKEKEIIKKSMVEVGVLK